ncbi:MAG: hypothetical protein R3F60_21650 [bacterium]
MRRFALLLALLPACDEVQTYHEDAASPDAASPDAASPDAASPDAGLTGLGVQCAPETAGPGPVPGDAIPCVEFDPAVDPPRQQAYIRADCTDDALKVLLDKRHLVVVPTNVTRPELWVHFGGSGGQPTNNRQLGAAAAEAGYRFISLAFANEPSIDDRCKCPAGPRPVDCEERVRLEVLYGLDLTNDFRIDPREAIVPRLVALLRYLDARRRMTLEVPGRRRPRR